MSAVAQFMEWLFIAAWCVAVAAHIYGSRYFFPMWAAGFKRKPEHEGYGRKALIGYAVFIGAVAVGFATGGVAELAGGWS
jgi:hypothetical protein